MSLARDKQIASGAEINVGIVKTSMYCHDCGKNFIASIDYDIDGNHEIICPICGHQHCRVIEKGVVTSDRWDTRNHNHTVSRTERIWSDNNLKMQTASTSAFLRERWLNFGN
jgi:DNA-directed RNA polymerase subunit RPC12/RpoP